jgi:hypothetical protein
MVRGFGPDGVRPADFFVAQGGSALNRSLSVNQSLLWYCPAKL